MEVLCVNKIQEDEMYFEVIEFEGGRTMAVNKKCGNVCCTLRMC